MFLTLYIIGTIFTFYYETEDIFLNKLNTPLQSTLVFSLCWPVSILFGSFVMWKEINKRRQEEK